MSWRQFSAINPDLNYIFWSPTTITKSISINMSRNNDPRIEKAMQVGRTSTTAKARVEAYQNVNEYLAQDLPYLWSTRAMWAIVAHPTVQNFNNPTTPTGAKAYGFLMRVDLADADLDELSHRPFRDDRANDSSVGKDIGLGDGAEPVTPGVTDRPQLTQPRQPHG